MVLSKVGPLLAGAGALAVLLLTSVGVWQVVGVTNRKIQLDNERYEKYRADYLNEWKLLDLSEAFQSKQLRSQWQETEDRLRTGAHATQEILAVFGWFIVLVALAATALVFAAGILGIDSAPTPAQPIAV